jgi:hypothetical protein
MHRLDANAQQQLLEEPVQPVPVRLRRRVPKSVSTILETCASNRSLPETPMVELPCGGAP